VFDASGLTDLSCHVLFRAECRPSYDAVPGASSARNVAIAAHKERKKRENLGAQIGVRARKVRNVLYGDGCKVEASPKDLVKNEVAYHATAI